MEYENNVAIGVHLYGGGVSTDTYVTALGVGSGGGAGGATSLTQLSDVNPNMNPQAGNVLTYLNGKWTAAAPSSGGSVTSISAGTGLTSSTGGAITSIGTISISTATMTMIENGATAFSNLPNYLQRADVKTLNLQGNGANVVTFDPKGSANATFNIEAAARLNLTRPSGQKKIVLDLAQITGVNGTWRKVTVDIYGRVTAGENPTTLQGYGITDAVVGIVVGSSTNVNKIGVKFKDNSQGSWITVPFASTAATASNATTATKLSTVSKKAWGQIYWTSGGVPTDIRGDMTGVGNITIEGGSRISQTYGGTAQTRSLYIGSEVNYGYVYFQDIASQSGVSYWTIQQSGAANFAGTVTVGNLASNGYVTALVQSSSSDERMKNIIEHFALSVEDIAGAPIVKFTWKFGEDKAIHAGSIAQYWQNVLPESVLEVDGKLSLQYGVLALLSAISLARTVVNHEQRIARLEKELSN